MTLTSAWFFFAALAVLLVCLVALWRKRRLALLALKDANETNEQLEHAAILLRSRLEELRKFEGVVDAESRGRELLAEAQSRADETVAKARAMADQLGLASQAIVADANTKAVAMAETARDITARAQLEAEQIALESRESAGRILDKATAEAETMVQGSRAEAEQNARAAISARDRVREYERVAEAMKNVIDGYGDRYVIPSSGVLDQLGSQYDFARAGIELKAARDRAKQLVKSLAAATCDYVEPSRRATAIAFVLDAFNGKVDSVLADAREDNFGTLEQRLKDAFELVNHNGRAFRNARITQEYMTAARDQLQWAVAAYEMKARDREEQRALKERIREEERAQRDFERAARDAEKEENLLRKAMDKVRKEVERAGDEQKTKYEDQLLELTEKLRLAEEKNKRALSMAQQTRSGHVYIISNEGSFGEHVYKIGLTRRLEPLDRVRELGDASVPFEFDVHALIRSEDAPALETSLHKRFIRAQVNKVNARKEFFRVTLDEIRSEVERLGLTAAWTMTAACRSWKETQALERALFNKQLDERAWEHSQEKQRESIPDDELVREAVG